MIFPQTSTSELRGFMLNGEYKHNLLFQAKTNDKNYTYFVGRVISTETNPRVNLLQPSEEDADWIKNN